MVSPSLFLCVFLFPLLLVSFAFPVSSEDQSVTNFLSHFRFRGGRSSSHSGGSVGIVEKKEFRLNHPYQTSNGHIIKDVRVGYETYGKLNKAKDNAILIAHYYSGTSHAAGLYESTDAVPGYWDEVIGPGKAFDTNKYFIISSDTLVNINAKDPHTITTGPASVNPETGHPYGSSFPVVTVIDFVRIQHELVTREFGIKKFVAVAGASGGSAQALQWAQDYPHMVPKVIAVVCPGFTMPAYSIATIDVWDAPIKVDKNWNGGNYYGAEEPHEGLVKALKSVTLSGVSFDWTDGIEKNGAAAALAASQDITKSYLVESTLQKLAEARAQLSDANHLLWTSRAYQTFEVNPSKIKAEVLFIPSSTDNIFPPFLSHAASSVLGRYGVYSDVYVLEGKGGHLDGVKNLKPATYKIEQFLRRSSESWF